jgi:hypothetical protein
VLTGNCARSVIKVVRMTTDAERTVGEGEQQIEKSEVPEGRFPEVETAPFAFLNRSSHRFLSLNPERTAKGWRRCKPCTTP